MKVMDVLKTAWAEVESFAKTKVAPWLLNFMGQVEHDVVTDIMPLVETAGAQVAVELISGQPAAAVGTTIAAIALQLGRNAEKAGVQVAAHDMSAAITGYLATLHATGGTATAAQPQ